MTMEIFRKQALLGCPMDYEIFERSLQLIIEKAHDGKTTHCGKVPHRLPGDERKQMELLNLRQQLDSAVRSEDYELAAQLRDRIKQTER